jgi:ParB family transcriptional regulator, chromosome partitioning protein
LVKLREKRSELDPLLDQHYVEDDAAYDAIKALSDRKLDDLIDVLTVECVTAHLQRKTALVWCLAEELGVEVRRYWRPDERWLSGYQKIQLAHLIGELRGPVFARAAENKKKSELVSELAKLFDDAANGRLEDTKLTAKLNEWLPSNLREEPQTDDTQRAAAA